MKIKYCGLFFYLLLFSKLHIFGQSHALNVFLRSENLKHASVGFEMIDLFSGKRIAAYNEDQSLVPASNMKLVTTATALEILGNDFSYRTSLFYDGIIENSVLQGNLYIEGSGDPTLGSEFTGENKANFLKYWLTAVQQAGIRRIAGNIIVMDQLFGYEGVSPKWLWEDLGNYYAPGIYGVSVFDNMYRVYLKSTIPQSKTLVLYTEPDIQDLYLNNTITASDSDADESFISGAPFANERYLYGTIPANRPAFAARGDIPDPGLFLSGYFTDYLRKNGVEVTGISTTYRLSPQHPETKQELAVVHSPDLAAITRIINVRSNNHYAEHLYKLLTIKDSLDISAYWKQKGLDDTALFMYDGSGLSPANAISAAFLVQLLKYMDKQGSNFYATLPIAGKEGTVASFLKGTALEGKARVKSGSMSHVQSYAGYIEKKEKRYAFALIVNRFTGERKEVRKAMAKLLTDLTASDL